MKKMEFILLNFVNTLYYFDNELQQNCRFLLKGGKLQIFQFSLFLTFRHFFACDFRWFT